jgi:nitrogen regulatory protein PII
MAKKKSPGEETQGGQGEKSPKGIKLPFKLQRLRTKGQVDQPIKKPPSLKMVFFIIDWNKAGIISKVFEDEKVRFHFISQGAGTASSEVLDILGLGAGEKAMIICVEQEVLIPVLLKEARKKLGFHAPGAGIAFTIPLSGINTPLLRVFKESINKNEKIADSREGVAMAEKNKISGQIEIQNDLIIAIINHGYSDELMNAAREAGASGGTVIHARGLTHEGPVKFFGVSVQDEKEIVLILTSRVKKLTIMETVSRSHGIASKAEGLIFSLPVESIMGLKLE